MIKRRFLICCALLALLASACGENDSAMEGYGSTNIGTSGSQDFGYPRGTIEAGGIPRSSDFDAQGFFSEHVTSLPPADCGELMCVHGMLGVMGNLINGGDCVVLQVGLNSPASVDSLPNLPLNLAVVVDVSGSMEGRNLEFVQAGLHTMLDSLEDNDVLSLVSYSDSATTLISHARVGDSRHLIRDAIDGLIPNGGTNLYGGLLAGYDAVEEVQSSEYQNRVILLTDGIPTAGLTGTSDIVGMSTQHNDRGVGLTTVGVGADFGFELMETLASQGGGNFYFV
ncbi:MAG: VWA domain-containing protein, partial [Myxococcales bacterium]|nr:VWA domain-containing protein [Myxococcales bacterium]